MKIIKKNLNMDGLKELRSLQPYKEIIISEENIERIKSILGSKEPYWVFYNYIYHQCEGEIVNKFYWGIVEDEFYPFAYGRRKMIGGDQLPEIVLYLNKFFMTDSIQNETWYNKNKTNLQIIKYENLKNHPGKKINNYQISSVVSAAKQKVKMEREDPYISSLIYYNFKCGELLEQHLFHYSAPWPEHEEIDFLEYDKMINEASLGIGNIFVPIVIEYPYFGYTSKFGDYYDSELLELEINHRLYKKELKRNGTINQRKHKKIRGLISNGKWDKYIEKHGEPSFSDLFYVNGKIIDYQSFKKTVTFPKLLDLSTHFCLNPEKKLINDNESIWIDYLGNKYYDLSMDPERRILKDRLKTDPSYVDIYIALLLDIDPMNP